MKGQALRAAVLVTLLWMVWTRHGESPQTVVIRLLDWRREEALPSQPICEQHLMEADFKRDDPQGWVSIHRSDDNGFNVRDRGRHPRAGADGA